MVFCVTLPSALALGGLDHLLGCFLFRHTGNSAILWLLTKDRESAREIFFPLKKSPADTFWQPFKDDALGKTQLLERLSRSKKSDMSVEDRP